MKRNQIFLIGFVIGLVFCAGCNSTVQQSTPVDKTISATPQVASAFTTTTTAIPVTTGTYYPPGKGPEEGHYYTGSGTNPAEPCADAILELDKCGQGMITDKEYCNSLIPRCQRACNISLNICQSIRDGKF